MTKRALLSVTNKEGIIDFAKQLLSIDWKIISTGGTAAVLRDAGVECILVEDVTGFPEMLGGRLKTLHPKIFGGILANREILEHMQAINAAAIEPIDLVAVNLYDFWGKPSIEQIDIGGPSLLRAAAKNAASVIPIIDTSDYGPVAQELARNGGIPDKMRERLAYKVFLITGKYDMDIASWMGRSMSKKQPFLRPADAH